MAFEPEERKLPLEWLVPEPCAALSLVRAVELDLHDHKAIGATMVPLDAVAKRVVELASTPWLESVTDVRLIASMGGVRFPPAQLEQLLATPLVEDVEGLGLRGCQIGGEEGARLIAECESFDNLAVLDLSFSYIEWRGLEALLKSEYLSDFILELGSNDVDDDPDDPAPDGFWNWAEERFSERGVNVFWS